MKTSALFKKIEQLQGDSPWGHVLDAGTGPKSLSWVSSLPTQRWTAVTAQRVMAKSTREALAEEPREDDRIILGNWADEALLAGETFDTAILDYFIGSIDAFAPYAQEALLQRVAGCTLNTLYVIGLEPYVPLLAEDEVGKFVGDLGRLRDACMLLARDRPYREFPASWVKAQLKRMDFEVTDTKLYPIRYRGRFLASQLEICEQRIARFTDAELAKAMHLHVQMMRTRGEALIEAHDGLPSGRDYVMRAVRSGNRK